jgi:hypothetical protein
MRIDLEQLKAFHSRLPRLTAQEYVHRAALALQRRHAPEVEMQVTSGGERTRAVLAWSRRSNVGAEMLDAHRVTEDAAEAVALGLVHAAHGWVVYRRLQREEYGDWLLYDDARRTFLCLEISGTDDGDVEARLTVKLAQVAMSPAAGVRAACVVRFREPLIVLELLPEVSP